MTKFIPSRKQNAAFVISFAFLFLTLFASAQTTTSWRGTGGTGWTTASNWTNGVPTASSDVIIGDENFTGTSHPAISTVVTVNSLTIGGVKASTLTISRAITINSDVLINANGTFSDAGSGSATTVKGDWINNGAYSANSGQSIIFSGTNQTISGSVATTFPTMSVSAGSTLTFSTNFSCSGTVTVNGKLIPAQTAKLTSGSLSIASGGSMHVTGATVADNYAMTPTLNAGCTVEYSGTINQTIHNFTYSHLRISGSGVKSLAANLTTFTTTTGNGNVYVDAATLDLLGFTMSRGTSGGIFNVAANATLRIGGTAAFPANFATVTLNEASTVEYYGTAQTVRAANYGHLLISGSRGASSVTLANSGTIGIAGTFTTSESYTTGGRIVTGSTILFNGTTQQTVPAFTFNNLTINNASSINLDADITISGVLTFTAGSVNTRSNKIILPSGGSVSGASQSTGWVNGNLQKHFSTIAGGSFEIGDATAYTPLSISFTTVSASGSLIANTTATAHPSVGSSTIANNRISRYWTISQPTSGALGFTGATLTFNWKATDNYSNLNTANLMVAQHNGTAWSYPAVNTPTSNSIRATGISTVGSFTAGQACAANFSFAKSNYCTSDGAANPVIAAGATGGTFSATPAGLSINASTGAINPAASAAGTYTVTNTITGSCSTSSTTSVTISTQPSATISYSGSPFCNSGTGTVTLTGIAGGVFSSTTGLSITASTGAINLGSSTPNTYTITYTLAATAACPQFQTTATVIIGPAIWKGTTSTDWSTLTNWSCSLLPTSTNDVVIPSGRTNYPLLTLTQTGLANNLTIQSGASLTVANATLKIAGVLSNSGTLTASNAATVEFNGTAAQTVPASVFAGNTVYNLTNNNSVSLTLQGTLNILNVLSLKAGTLYTNGHLTLKSTVDNTARLEQITSTAATPIVGDVTVERYVPGKRKYRLLAPSVTTSTSETLAAGQENLSIWAHWQNSGVTDANAGTLITGGTAADGFDTQTSTASLYSYNESTKRFVAFNSASGKKTKYTPLRTGQAYYMFVYGDRRNSISASSPNPTVLKAKGSLSVGNQVFNTTSATPLSNTVGNYALVGNPYACPVDWKNVPKTGVSNTLWGWDANLNSTGGYVTVTSTITGAIVSPTSSLVQVSRYIQPGQGFFVRTIASSPQVTFSEASKVSTSTAINNLVFRTVNVEAQPLMAVNLIYTSAGVPVLADGAVAGFHETYSKEVRDEEDGLKMVNSNDGLSLSQGGTLLGIDNRPFPQSNDTLFISFSRLTKTQYTLEVFGQDLTTTTALPVLQDTYLNTLTPLSLIDTNRINFSVVAADPASASANRFRIIFHQLTTLPVTFTSVAASKKDKQVIVDWKVSSEAGIKKYEIERSANGISFSKVGEVPARGGNETQLYQWLDVSPLSGTNWYRIRSVEGADQGLYSKSVNVSIVNGKASVVVVPNPVKGRQINIQVRDMEKGIITAGLFDQRGTEILRRSFDHKGGTANYSITPGGPLASGIYYLKLMKNNEAYTLDILIE